MIFFSKIKNKPWLISILAIVFLLLSVFWLSKNINQVKIKESILSRTDYRIFACGEEIFLKNDTESLKTKRNGFFARSKLRSIIADGTPLNSDDVLLSSFFDAAGGILEYTTENKIIFRIPTETGCVSFEQEIYAEVKKRIFL